MLTADPRVPLKSLNLFEVCRIRLGRPPGGTSVRSRRGAGFALAVSVAFAMACSPVPTGLPLPATVAPGAESPELRRTRQVLARVPDVLAKNHKAFAGPKGAIEGFGAGEAYPQIWLRDSAWIVPAAAGDYGPTALLSWLDLHLDAATPDGRLRDWVAIAKPETFREWAPKVAAVGPIAVDTNTNESDQEPSAALAYCRAVEALSARGDAAAVSGPTHAARVTRLTRAMDGLLRDRTDAKSGLVWAGLTADWGDVSPLYPDQRAIYLDAKTPRTLSLYANVVATAALDCLARLDGPKTEQARLAARAAAMRNAVRARFWMSDLGYFRVRLPLDPLPEAFRDDTRFALGGNALAALLGVADDAQSASIFAKAEALRVANHYSTIATALIPPYDAGVFQHPAMKDPFQYQNGGQWDWYGAALIEAEFTRGHAEAARRHLDQMVARILHAGSGIHEWYTSDGEPKGSASYAAAAASIHGAIVRGLLGIARSADGVRVTLRTTETVREFDVPGRRHPHHAAHRQGRDDSDDPRHAAGPRGLHPGPGGVRGGRSRDNDGSRKANRTNRRRRHVPLC
jgi:hypothetical protein